MCLESSVSVPVRLYFPRCRVRGLSSQGQALALFPFQTVGLCMSPPVRYSSDAFSFFLVLPSFCFDKNPKKGLFQSRKIVQIIFSFSFVVSFFISVIKDLAGLAFFFGLEDSYGLEHPKINDVQKFPLCLLWFQSNFHGSVWGTA